MPERPVHQDKEGKTIIYDIPPNSNKRQVKAYDIGHATRAVEVLKSKTMTDKDRKQSVAKTSVPLDSKRNSLDKLARQFKAIQRYGVPGELKDSCTHCIQAGVTCIRISHSRKPHYPCIACLSKSIADAGTDLATRCADTVGVTTEDHTVDCSGINRAINHSPIELPNRKDETDHVIPRSLSDSDLLRLPGKEAYEQLKVDLQSMLSRPNRRLGNALLLQALDSKNNPIDQVLIEEHDLQLDVSVPDFSCQDFTEDSVPTVTYIPETQMEASVAGTSPDHLETARTEDTQAVSVIMDQVETKSVIKDQDNDGRDHFPSDNDSSTSPDIGRSRTASVRLDPARLLFPKVPKFGVPVRTPQVIEIDLEIEDKANHTDRKRSGSLISPVSQRKRATEWLKSARKSRNMQADTNPPSLRNDDESPMRRLETKSAARRRPKTGVQKAAEQDVERLHALLHNNAKCYQAEIDRLNYRIEELSGAVTEGDPQARNRHLPGAGLEPG